MLVSGTPNSKAFSYIFSASVIFPLGRFLVFPPHSMIFSDLPAKKASTATGTLYFAAFILPKTIIQSAFAPLSFKPSNKIGSSVVCVEAPRPESPETVRA